MTNLKSESNNEEEKKSLRGYSVTAVALFFIMHSCNFLGEGLGVSRASEYFNYYDGSMSYTEVPAIITVKEINETPDENYSWEVLQFGCKLDKQQEIIADVEAAGIPKEHIQTIFYSRELFDAPLEVGNTYFVKLDIHANYYSFLFKDKVAFGVYWWRQLLDTETQPTIEPYPWRNKLNVYAVACWIQVGLILSIIFFANDSKKGLPAEKKLTITLTAVYLMATLWIIYVDFPFYKDWSSYFLQVIALAIGLGCLGYTAWNLRETEFGSDSAK